MVDLGDENISNGWARGLHLGCPRAGPAQLEQVVESAPLPSLLSQDSLLSRQTVLTHMCEELI